MLFFNELVENELVLRFEERGRGVSSRLDRRDSRAGSFMKRPSQISGSQPTKGVGSKGATPKSAKEKSASEREIGTATAKKSVAKKSVAQKAGLTPQEAAHMATLPPFTSSDLTRWRKAHRYTPAEFAARLPVAVHTVRDWERGHSRIPAYLRRVLKDMERESLPNNRPRVRDMTPYESRFLIGQVIIGYAPDFEGYERLLLGNGWSMVLCGERAEGRWFVENSPVDDGENERTDERDDAGGCDEAGSGCTGETPRRGRFIRLGWGSCSSLRIMIRAFKVLYKLKQEGNVCPTPYDLLRECAAMTHLPLGETLQTQRCLLHEAQRMQDAMARRRVDENSGDENTRDGNPKVDQGSDGIGANLKQPEGISQAAAKGEVGLKGKGEEGSTSRQDFPEGEQPHDLSKAEKSSRGNYE